MNAFVIDAFAWVEYFNGTQIGEKVKEIVENEKNKITSNVITIAELASYFSRHNKNFDEVKKIVLSLSSIYHIPIEFAEKAGKLHTELRKERKHMGLADIFVLLTARELQSKVVTGDEDFRGLKEALMIK
tara:strand:- start:50228 stop:50617 length:390 start_codon:yes stop_codon:yes gene_type:complete